MLSNRLAFAAVAIACVAAAGGGSYLATRHGTPAAVEPVTLSAADGTVVKAPVQETEAVVGDGPAPTPAAPASTERQAAPPERRSVPAPRRARREPQSAGAARPSNHAQPPTLDRSWPSSAATERPAESASSPSSGDTRQEPVLETSQPVEPPQPTFRELVVSADSVIGLQPDRALSSERSRVEDPVEARVTRDVRVDGEVAIPAGTRAVGSVMVVERGGKFKERARLGIRFHTLVMADGSRLPITTETIYRYGEAPGNGSAARIGGGAVAGAILGAILGGGKGAAVGAATGAGAGTAVAASGERSEAMFPAGSDFTARILSPVTVTLEK